MTDPTGLSFLSYRRSRIDDAKLLIEAQHDLGMPTWQDLADLGEGHTDAQLRAVLADPSTANAIAYLTPDVKDSATITRTELPQILKRTEANDSFFLTPVAAGGLEYKDIAATVGTYVGSHDIGQWNVTKIDSDPLTPADAFAIGKRTLKHRLQAIHAVLPVTAPLRLTLHTRAKPPVTPDTALSLDWTHRFSGREALPDAWNSHLLPAAAEVCNAILRFAPNRPLLLSGLCALPAAIALGASFMATRGIDAQWQQPSAKRETQDWGLGAPRQICGCQTDLKPFDTNGDDVAVLVSIASNVEPAFAASRPSLPAFRTILHIKAPASFPHDLTTPGQAAELVALVVEGLRRARDEFQARGAVHLFLAIPVGVAFMLGQSLNTVGPVQTYEHLPSDAVGRYVPAALLRPGT